MIAFRNKGGRPSTALSWLILLGSAWSASPAAADTDWILLLDRSESMIQNDPGNYRFDAQKIMVDLLALGVNETHRLTIIRFSGTPEVVMDRKPIQPENLTAIRATISQDPPQGDTDIGAALALARKTVAPEGRASDIKVVLLSDGVQAGKIPGLRSRLEEEKRAYQELGLSIHTIILNDFSLSPEEREKLRGARYSYEDKVLHEGEDLMRDLARRTRGRVAQILPGREIENILLDLIAPYMSFHREAIAGRIRTYPTDRQLFVLINRSTEDARFRIGNQELTLDLRREQAVAGDFAVNVNPYSNRTVVLVRPSEGSRWPEWVDILPGPSGKAVQGEIFVISNVRLSAVQGFGVESSGAQEGIKTRVRENELYPVLFRITIPDDVGPDRRRSIVETLKDATVRVVATDGDGKAINQSVLPAGEIVSGTRSSLYFVPTYLGKGEVKLREPLGITVSASLEAAGGSGARAIARAPDRPFVVNPSSFEWIVRRNWKGDAESASRPVAERAVALELGQEFRLEVVHSGEEVLGNVEILADFSKAGEAAARKLALRDMGGMPRAFQTDWIFPTTAGAYVAKVTIKSDVVQEVSYSISVLRDDFRPADAQYSADGKDTAKPGTLGGWVKGEKIEFSRTRTLDRLSAAATAQYWQTLAATSARAHVLRRDAGGGWVVHRQVPLEAEAPKPGAQVVTVRYSGEVTDLVPGEYLLTWPENRPLVGDPASDSRSDAFQVLGPPLSSQLCGEDGKPLAVEEGKAIHQAGKTLVLKVTPTETFPTNAGEQVVGTLTWARKDVGGPQVVNATKGADGSYSAEFPTTDFHTGAAKLSVKLLWKAGGRDRMVQEDRDVSSMTKALGLAIEPVSEDIFLGERDAAIRFRIRAVGGQNPQIQKDLLSLWLSHPVNVSIGESSEIFRVNLEAEKDHLVGSLDKKDLEPGSYKLVANSPVAKLGQDIAACFFNIKPSPYEARVLQSTSGEDEKMLLGPGVASASARGDGVCWVLLEPSKGAADGASRLVAAAVTLNGKEWPARWSPLEGGGLRSQPVALESLPPDATIVAEGSDEAGRTFAWSLGSVRVEPVPLSPAVTWLASPPTEIGRGQFHRIRGIVQLRGGSIAEREKVRDELKGTAETTPFVAVVPPSALGSFQVLPESSVPPAGPEGTRGLFGERVPFEVTLRAPADDSSIQDQVRLEVKVAGQTVEERRFTVGLSGTRLQVGRPDADPKGVITELFVPIMAREKVRVALEHPAGGAPAKYRIQVFAPEGVGAGGARPIVSGEEPVVDWSPRVEGAYRISAEVITGADFGWTAEEILQVAPPMKLEWATMTDGTVRLDAGQNLPLVLRVVGPNTLDWDLFQKLFRLEPELLGEGAQVLAVDFSPWEQERAPAGAAGLVLKSTSTKSIPATAARVRVSVRPRADATDATPLDALDLQIVKGGGSVVVVENFEKGEAAYRLRDLVPGYQIPKGSLVRFGYRKGDSLTDVSTLKNRISASVKPTVGEGEKVLDVESVGQEVVVFSPYEAAKHGTYRVELAIKGETQLRQAPEFEVVRSFGESLVSLALIGAGLVGVVLLGLLARVGRAYQQDRGIVMERIEARKAKALQDLQAEPSERLLGEVRVAIAGKTLGPLDLDKAASNAEVSSWVSQHFSTDPMIFADPEKNQRRRSLVDRCLAGARTELLAETEKRLPVRGADLCVRERDGKVEAELVHDAVGAEHPGLKTLLTLRVLEGGKLRVSTPTGKSVTLDRRENLAFNGWIGKNGDQIRASVKVPGFADYSTVTVDLK